MTETNSSDKGGKKLGLNKPKTLELNKTVESGAIRQSFSHGRSKMVQVEVRKKRTFSRDSGGKMAEDRQDAMATEIAALNLEAEPDNDTSNLTNAEKANRAKVLEEAKVEAERRAEEDAKAAEAAEAQAIEDAKVAEAAAIEAAKTVEEEASREKAPSKPAKTEEEAPVASEAAPAPAAPAAPKPQAKPEVKAAPAADKPARHKAPAKKEEDNKRAPSRRGEPKRRRSGKLTISDALRDGEERIRSLAAVKRARAKEKALRQGPMETKKVFREVIVPEVITVQELANRMTERGGVVIKTLMNMGVMATINQTIDADTAELVIEEFGHTMKRVTEADVEEGMRGIEDAPDTQSSRPPIVTVMGHVDHGKTSLLDALRTTDVAAGEAGGITQHIGAYQVHLAGGQEISFIDTPGHAAFTEMRSRGAKVTDIVVLCVAADDGVMPQTIEAIHHSKAAGVPIIIAINKIDLPGADPSRVKQELLQHEIVVEDMGGEVLTVEVSAKQRTNLDKLEEAILLQAEILDLKANPDRSAEGVIVESRMVQGRGTVATVLVQRGTLNVGDIFVAGQEWGRVRALDDDHGRSIKSVLPGQPAEVLGLNGTPNAGDDLTVVANEQRAREITEYRQRQAKDLQATKAGRGTLEQMFEKIKEGEKETLPVVIKADVHGSVEALEGAIEKMNTDEVSIQVLHRAVGGINESDVTLANASGALIIGFNVRANPQARTMARADGVEIRYYSIIYDAIDELKAALSGMLAPEIKETFIGNAEIREVFNVSKVGKVAGCIVIEGNVKRGAKVRLLRDDVVIHEGELSQLKRFKDDAKEVREGTECGMAFANYHDLKVGDVIECFDVEEIARKLD
jgi:translation initiation factor IF-2